MARTMEKILPVKTSIEELNCWGTIERSMLSATNAALRIGDKKLAETLRKLKNEAANKYNIAFANHKAIKQ